MSGQDQLASSKSPSEDGRSSQDGHGPQDTRGRLGGHAPNDSATAGRVERQYSGRPDRAGSRGGSFETPHAPLADLIGRTRFVILIAVAAVLLIAMTLFVLGAGFAVASTWKAVVSAFGGNLASTDLTVEMLEVVSIMLKAVIFYIIGVGLYSLFIAPLNVTTALGIETFNDLEIKVVSVIIVIMAITFLEHFILWQQPVEMVLYGLSLAAVVYALVAFSNHSHRSRQDLQDADGMGRARAQQELFQEDREQREVVPDLIAEDRQRPS